MLRRGDAFTCSCLVFLDEMSLRQESVVTRRACIWAAIQPCMGPKASG